jgi:hypothetical protein
MYYYVNPYECRCNDCGGDIDLNGDYELQQQSGSYPGCRWQYIGDIICPAIGYLIIDLQLRPYQQPQPHWFVQISFGTYNLWFYKYTPSSLSLTNPINCRTDIVGSYSGPASDSGACPGTTWDGDEATFEILEAV